MRKISLFLICFIFSYSAYAGEIDGQLRAVGAFFGSSAPLSGDIDIGNNTLQFDPSTLYGAAATFSSTELLVPGTYTRIHNLVAGGASVELKLFQLVKQVCILLFLLMALNIRYLMRGQCPQVD